MWPWQQPHGAAEGGAERGLRLPVTQMHLCRVGGGKEAHSCAHVARVHLWDSVWRTGACVGSTWHTRSLQVRVTLRGTNGLTGNMFRFVSGTQHHLPHWWPHRWPHVLAPPPLRKSLLSTSGEASLHCLHTLFRSRSPGQLGIHWPCLCKALLST